MLQSLLLLLALGQAPDPVQNPFGATQKVAEPPFVILPATLECKPGRLVKLIVKSNCKSVRWVLASDDADLIVSESGAYAIFCSPADGKFLVMAWGAVGDEPTEAAKCWITVGKGPDPKPDPKPDPPKPDPKPDPKPAPIPVDGFRVLVVYESSVRSDTAKIMQSSAVANYLLAKCAKGPDGKSIEARIFDKDVPMDGAAPHWQNAMKRPRGNLPWIIVSNGRAGFEGPLPATVEETLALLKKYGD